MKRITVFLMAAALLCAATSFGADPKVEPRALFVAPDGTADGDGSEQKPIGLAQVAALKLNPGDEVIFKDGVYSFAKVGGRGLSIGSVGTAELPITYRAQNRHKAILDGGTPVTGWQKTAGMDGVWEARGDVKPKRFMVNGDFLIDATSQWHRRDNKETLLEGMFAIEKQPEGPSRILIAPWAKKEPTEVFALNAGLMSLGGAFTVIDGFLLRRSGYGIGVGGAMVKTYRMKNELKPYFDLCSMSYNVFGSFNVVRNCIIRDMAGQGMTSNESRFNLIEDCVIYNAGLGQGEHGIYVSQGSENLTIRRCVWWRTSGGAIHIYSGSGTDSPKGVTCEYNIFGPDKRNRCFPIKNRKSTAFYIWGGHRYAGFNRITHNIIIGPYDRAMSIHKCNFNLVANNVILNTDGAPIQLGTGYGSIFANNIVEYSPGGADDGAQMRPAGYYTTLDPAVAALHTFTNNLLLPRGDKGTELPAFEKNPVQAKGSPFLDRAKFDFRLKEDSEAVNAGIGVPYVTKDIREKAADIGALEFGQEQAAENAFPEIPDWLLKEWPLSKRGQ